jgi:cell division protein FtsI (penicillin-binding protein 3)
LKFKSWKRKQGDCYPTKSFNLSRVTFITYLVISGFSLLIFRAIYLQITPLNRVYLEKIVNKQYQKNLTLAPSRGPIFDRREDPLAISIQVPSIAINPKVFSPNEKELRSVSQILNLKPSLILSRKSRKDRYFVWLKRHIDPKQAMQVQNLNLDGLIIIQEPTRFYAAGHSAANLIGFTGFDNSGLFGIEQQYEAKLRGEPVKLKINTDARGKYIFQDTSEPNSEKTGHEVHLTIDRAIQEITAHELETGLLKARSNKGFAIVSDPHSGHILAIANYPNFDPNNRHTKIPPASFRNSALSDLFEPGSVVKPFVIGQALDTNLIKKEDSFFCENGALKIGESVIHDTHPSGDLNISQTIVTSSNICTFKIASKLGKDGLYNAFHEFGLFRPEMSLSFPGQLVGRISPWVDWKPIRFANISFGHGFVVSGLELVQAMGAFANGGRLMKPSLVTKIVNNKGQIIENSGSYSLGQIISPQTALEMREMLALVVTDKSGTGSKAKTKLYTTAGKTGTAQKVLPGFKGYAKDRYIASFLGFAPVKDPHLVIYVYVDEPQEKPYYGGVWAAPIFAAIAEKSLKYLNVAPDLLVSEKSNISLTKPKVPAL